MKNVLQFFSKVIAAVLCLSLVLCAACSSKSEKTEITSSDETVQPSDLDIEFKYSDNCSVWTEVTSESELFRADGKYAAGDAEVVYLHIKNHSETPINYKIKLNIDKGNAGGAMFGYVGNIRAQFADIKSAVAAVESNAEAVGSGYVLSECMEADSAVTMALVVYIPGNGAAAEMKLSVDFSAVAVYTDNHTIVEDPSVDTVIADPNDAFKAVFKAGSLSQGDYVEVIVKESETDNTYDIVLSVNGKAYTGEAVELSLSVGCGFESVEIYSGETKTDADYNMYTGTAVFNIIAGGTFTVKNSGRVDISGVMVQGADKPFDDFNAAVNYVVNANASEIGETVKYIVFGKVKYHVAEGEKVSLVGEHSQVKTVKVTGADDEAEIVIDGDSGSLPSLPYADKGVGIIYSDIVFDSEKTSDVKNLDYRGNADITFKNCTFKRALATRGPSSDVVIDGCLFACKEYSDTLKGYCYYSGQAIGADSISVRFINNSVTESWGGVNFEWGQGDFYIAGNTFSGFNCSKPAIQLSSASTVVIENNKFSNIKDENVIRFYSAYGADSTHIIGNEIDADYLFYSDKPNAINGYRDFRFEDNTISGTTDLTLGHITNAAAGDVREHGYVVDTTLNTVK